MVKAYQPMGMCVLSGTIGAFSKNDADEWYSRLSRSLRWIKKNLCSVCKFFFIPGKCNLPDVHDSDPMS
jgi:hypothetical protein